MFWFKKKEIVVDCFTMHRSVYELYKPDHSMQYFPKEIKDIPKFQKTIEQNTKIEYEVPTIRTCNGIIDYYKQGIILPMWADFISQPKTAAAEESSIGMQGKPFYFITHPKTQYPGIFDDYIHVKFGSPWLIREKSGVKFIWESPIWNLQKYCRNFVVLPGIVSYNVQHQTNLNVFINKQSENFTLFAGTPVAHITPLTDKRIILKHHLITPPEYDKLGIPDEYMQAPGTKRYLRWLKEKKQAEERESKCPFGFGK